MGNSIWIFKTSIAPMTAEMGSTIPLRLPKRNDLLLLIPSRRKGRDTAEPSGKFWIPIPNANINAALTVAPSMP